MTATKAIAKTIAERQRRSPVAVANSGASAADPNFAAAPSATIAPRAGGEVRTSIAPTTVAAISESFAFAFIV